MNAAPAVYQDGGSAFYIMLVGACKSSLGEAIRSSDRALVVARGLLSDDPSFSVTEPWHMQRDAILVFEEAEHSKADVLGASYMISLGSVSGSCHLPGGSYIAGSRLGPPHSSLAKVPGIDWGMANSSPSVTVRAVILSFDLPTAADGKSMVTFTTSTNSWANALRDWLALLADGPTDHMWDGPGAAQWVDKAVEDSVTTVLYREGRFHQPDPLSRWQWGHALDHASAGTEPPVARTLLIRAERAAFLERTREAVVDAATAVEIAITTGVRQRLAELGTDPNVTKRFLSARECSAPHRASHAP